MRGATRMLLRNEADPNGRDAQGRPAAIIAARAGAFDTVSDLLGAEADPMLMAPDGQTLLALLRESNNAPLTVPAPAGIAPDAPELPSGQAQTLAEVPKGPDRIDPVYPSELDADGEGGIGPPIASFLDRFAHRVRADENRALRAHFNVPPPAAETAKRIAEIDREEQQGLVRRATLRQQHDAALADRTRLSREVLNLQAQISRLDQARARKRAQVTARMAEVQAQLNLFLQARQEVLAVKQDLDALHEDFVMGSDARFDRLAEARRASQTAQSDIAEAQDSFNEMRQQSRDRHKAELRGLRGDLDERRRRLSEEIADLASAQNELDRSQNNVNEARRHRDQARAALIEHLFACKAQNEAHRINCHHPQACPFIDNRNESDRNASRAQSRADIAQSKVRSIEAKIVETRGMVERERLWVREAEKPLVQQFEREFEILERREQSSLQELRRDYSQAQTIIARHTTDLEARTKFLNGLVKEGRQNIVARFGPDHDRLYGAMVRFVGGLRAGRIVEGEALWGYAEILKLGEEMDAAGVSAPAFEEVRDAMSGLDLAWQVFGSDHLAQIALTVQLSDRQTLLQAAHDRLAVIAADLDGLDRKLDALRLERANLNAEQDGVFPSELDKALRLSDARIAVTVELLAEAFRPAATRILTASDLTEGTWGAELQQLTGRSWPNMVLRGTAALPQAVANGTVLTDPRSDVVQFTALDRAASEGVIAAWLPKIDFVPVEWRAAAPAQGDAALQAVFMAAMIEGARFDQASFIDGGLPSYRLVTPRGSYWIREEGSLLSFLDTDIAPLFEYAFEVPAGTAQGDILRAAYAEFVAGMKGGFDALPPERKRLAAAIEAAFRTFDNKRYERLIVQYREGFEATFQFLVSASPAGQFVTIGGVLYDFATTEDVGLAEAAFTVALERLNWTSLAKLKRLKLRAFFPSAEDALIEMHNVLLKDSLFHRAKLYSMLNLDDEALQFEIRRQAEVLHLLVSQAADFTEIDDATAPTLGSRWSTGAPVIQAQLSAPVNMTRLRAVPSEIFVTGTLTPQRLDRLESCLGEDLQPALRRTSLTGAIVIGVARSNNQSCLVVTRP